MEAKYTQMRELKHLRATEIGEPAISSGLFSISPTENLQTSLERVLRKCPNLGRERAAAEGWSQNATWTSLSVVPCLMKGSNVVVYGTSENPL